MEQIQNEKQAGEKSATEKRNQMATRSMVSNYAMRQLERKIAKTNPMVATVIDVSSVVSAAVKVAALNNSVKKTSENLKNDYSKKIESIRHNNDKDVQRQSVTESYTKHDLLNNSLRAYNHGESVRIDNAKNIEKTREIAIQRLEDRGLIKRGTAAERSQELYKLTSMKNQTLHQYCRDQIKINGVIMTQEDVTAIGFIKETSRIHREMSMRMIKLSKASRYISRHVRRNTRNNDMLNMLSSANRTLKKNRRRVQMAQKAVTQIAKIGIKGKKKVVIKGQAIKKRIIDSNEKMTKFNALVKKHYNILKKNSVINEKKEYKSRINRTKSKINKAGKVVKNKAAAPKNRFRKKITRHFSNKLPPKAQQKLKDIQRRIMKRKAQKLAKEKLKSKAMTKVLASKIQAISALPAKITGILLSPPVLLVLLSLILIAFMGIAVSAIAGGGGGIPNFIKGESDEDSDNPMRYAYSKVLADEQDAIETVVNEAAKSVDNITIEYQTMNENGKWVSAGKQSSSLDEVSDDIKNDGFESNVKQIISMGATVFDDKIGVAGEDGEKVSGNKWSKKILQAFYEYCSTLAKESIDIKTLENKESFCSSEQELKECTNLDKDGKCNGHTNSTVRIRIYSFPTGDNYEKALAGQRTLFDIDNDEEGYYDYLSKEKKKELDMKDSSTGYKSNKKNQEDKTEAVKTNIMKGFYLTCYSAVGDAGNGTWGRSTSSGNPAVAYSDHGSYITAAVDNDLIPQGTYFTISTFGDKIKFRADDTGSAIKGKHIDIFTVNAKIPEVINGVSVDGSWSTKGAVVTLLDGSNFNSSGNSGTYWDEETKALAIAKCQVDWKDVYGIDETAYKLNTVSIKNNIKTQTGKIFNTQSNSVISKSTKHIVEIEESTNTDANVEEKEYKFKIKSFDDVYYNKIQYTIVKWALSRDKTGVYSQSDRIMQKNPSASASTDCSGFVSWVLAKTKDELNLTSNEWRKEASSIMNNLGFGGDKKLRGILTTDNFKSANANLVTTNSKDLLPGDILVRLGPSDGHASSGGTTGNNHVAIFLGFTSKGYQYIDCTTRKGGGPAIKVVNTNQSKPLNDGNKGSSTNSTWWGAVRLFDYSKLNDVVVEDKEYSDSILSKCLFTSKSLQDQIKKEKIPLPTNSQTKKSYTMKHLFEKSDFPWRLYKKYGGVTQKLPISLD